MSAERSLAANLSAAASLDRAVLATHEPSVFATAIGTLYRHAPKVLAANVLNAAVVAVVLWGRADRSALGAWLVAMAAMVAVRWRLNRGFEPNAPPSVIARWARRFTIGSAFSGLLWGSAGIVLFSPGDLPTQVLLAFTIGGMAAGASSSVASHLPAFYAFVIPAVLPLVVRFAAAGDAFHGGMAAMLGLFVLLVTMIGRTTHATIVEGYRLGFVNDALVGRLYDAHRDLENANTKLEARVEARTAQLVQETAARQAAERQLHHAQKLEALGRLTGGVAHDFNNLLTVIVSALDSIPDAADSCRRATLLRHAKEAALRGGSLTRSLLAFSRRERLQTEVIDPCESLRSMTHGMLRRALPEATDLRLQLPDNPIRLKVDVAQLETAILNLVLNARDAMPQGGPIAVELRAVGQYLEIAVRDRGGGIRPELVDRVFEPFFTTKGDAGTGLGLSMVYGFAEQCGGTVNIESELGVGTTVRMLLPRVSSALAPAPPSDASPLVRGHGQCVLIVEDEGPVRELTAISVGALGYTTLQAGTAAQALETLATHPEVALVLTDILMPGSMDGVDLAHEVRRRRPALPVILASGYSAETRDTGDFVRLAKPYRRSALADSLDAALHRQ